MLRKKRETQKKGSGVKINTHQPSLTALVSEPSTNFVSLPQSILIGSTENTLQIIKHLKHSGKYIYHPV